MPAYRELARLTDFFAQWQIIDFDDDAARCFKDMRCRGVRIATMDLKIASIALVHGALLFTANTADFGAVPGLNFEDWSRE